MRIDVGFKFFSDLCKSEIVDEHCPHEVDTKFPDIDFDTYKFGTDCIAKGCRGMTCEECWETNDD